MRVACVSSFADFVGGGEHSLFDLMTHLPAEVEPVLLVPAEGALSARAAREGILWRVAPMSPIGARSPAELWRWLRLLRGIRPDILHANNSRAAFYAGLAGRMLGAPMLFHCRVNRPDRRLDGMIVRMASGVIANSRATAERFAAWRGRLPVWVVHNGVDVGWLEEAGGAPPVTGRVLLMVARVSRLKRHDLALEVFKRLVDRARDLHLALAGGKDDEEWWNALQRKSRALPAADRVHWLGDTPPRELARWYKAADVVMLPSDDESFGRVLVEAMAAGVPPVAFATGGVPEVVGHGKQGLLVPPGDVDAMTDAVARLLADDDLRRRMGEAGRARAREFSVARHVERICGIYREVTGDG